MAREYFLNGAIVPVDYYYGSSFPQNGQLIGTIGFLMGGQITAQLLMIWCMGLLSTITIYSISKSLNLSKNGSLISILIWNTSISILFLYQSSKIDIMWSFFDLLGIYAFSKWFYDYNSQQKSNWLVISGFMFSMSFGIKHVSAFTIFLLLLAIFLVMYKNNNSLKITFKYSFLFLFPISISFFWIFRSYILSGSLFYSGSNLPNETGLLGIFDIIWNMSMLGNASSFEGPMGKSIGPTILAILPTILICKNINSKVLHVLLFSSFMIILWYNGVQRARHLLPTLALLSVTCGYLIDVLPSKYIRYKFFLITMIVTVSLINISQWIHYNFFSIKRVEYIFNNDLDNYLENNLDKFEWYPNFSMTKFINNSLPKDCKIAALSTGNSYYINRKFYSVSKKLGPSFNESIQDIDFIKFYEKLKEFGITHIFLNHFVINQYQLHLCILNSHDFQNKYLKKIMSSGGQIIYEVL